MSREYSVVASVGVTPADPAITTTAQIIQQATSESPLRLRLSLRNSGDESRRLDLGYTPPFSRYVLTGDGGESALVLVPPDYSGFPGVERVRTGGSDECWTAKGVPEILETGTLATPGPDEGIEREYVLLDHPENASCFPAGRYSREDTITIDGSRFEIGFVANVERPA